MPWTDCENCENKFEYSTGRRTPFTEENPPRLCPSCVDDEEFESIGRGDAPEGGWPRNSDIDRL